MATALTAVPAAHEVEIVVPVYNEELALSRSVRRLHDYLEASFPFSWRILVVDNASTDGTPDLLRERYRGQVEPVCLPTNEGSAGGFHEGVRLAHQGGYEWIWLMDDDTMPTPTALAELLAAAGRTGLGHPPALLSSKVVWTDGAMHPMNNPGFEREAVAEVVAAAERGLMPLRVATFPSLLVHRGAVDRHGLPLKRYFLWSDDIEYTARILRREPGYLVPASVAVHKTQRPYTAMSSSGPRFYFHARNTVYMLRGSAWSPREKPGVLFVYLQSVLEYLRANGFALRNVAIVARGIRDGLRPGAPVASRP